MCQSRLPNWNEQESGSILTTPGMATVMALTRRRQEGLGMKDWRFFERVSSKACGSFSVGNLRRLRQSPCGEKSASRVFVPPMSMLRNIL